MDTTITVEGEVAMMIKAKGGKRTMMLKVNDDGSVSLYTLERVVVSPLGNCAVNVRSGDCMPEPPFDNLRGTV